MADEAKPYSSSFIKLPRGAKDLTGRTFGQLVAIGPTFRHPKRGIKWLVRCSCGGTAEYFANILISGKNVSCGCIGKPLDLTNRRFERLVAVKVVGKKRGLALWLCQCDCGATTEVPSRDLRHGNTKSCGCLKAGTLRTMHLTHGMTRTPTYACWQAMHNRCHPDHPQHVDYFDRGIRVCERWASFENFYADMGEQPGRRYSVDRKNNDGPYAPGNCRWATPLMQANNTRQVHWVEYKGERLSVSEAARRYGLKTGTLWFRLKKGWSAERALTTPTKRGVGSG